MAILVSGCVAPDPPNYGAARQTPPFVDATGATPSVLVVTPKKLGDPPVQFVIDFKSEDAGEDLQSLLYLNWSIPEKEHILDLNTIPASTFEESRKASGLYWQVEQLGCQQVSLLLFHPSTGYDRERKRPTPGADIAQVTWWFNVSDPQDSTTEAKLSDCPKNVGGP